MSTSRNPMIAKQFASSSTPMMGKQFASGDNPVMMEIDTDKTTKAITTESSDTSHDEDETILDYDQTVRVDSIMYPRVGYRTYTYIKLTVLPNES